MPFRTVMLEPAIGPVDGQLLAPRRLQAVAKMKETLPNASLARDRPLKVSSEPEMRVSVDKFSVPCDNFGLTVNFPRTGSMGQSGPHAPDTEPKITIKGQKLQPWTTSVSLAAPVPSSDR